MNTSKPNDINFATVLASSVHDMKNSLALVLQQLENVIAQTQDSAVGKDIAQISYEAQRINATLVQLLDVYRYQQRSIPLNLEHNYVDEMLEEVLMNNQLYLDNKGINLHLELDEDCQVFCDRDLIINLLNDIIVNAMRYTADSLYITAEQSHLGTTFEIADNGPGYPPEMLELVAKDEPPVLHEGSRTGLGLFFAQQIAAAHQRDGKKGFICLENGGNLGGSVFKLVLP